MLLKKHTFLPDYNGMLKPRESQYESSPPWKIGTQLMKNSQPFMKPSQEAITISYPELNESCMQLQRWMNAWTLLCCVALSKKTLPSGLILCPSIPTFFLKINGFRITSELQRAESVILTAEEPEEINTCIVFWVVINSLQMDASIF